MLGNLNGFEYKKFRGVQYSGADLYVLTKLHEDIKKIDDFYDKYDYKNIIKLINKNITELSS